MVQKICSWVPIKSIALQASETWAGLESSSVLPRTLTVSVLCYQSHEPQHLHHRISSPPPAGFYQRYHNPFLQPSYHGTPGLTHASRASLGLAVASDIQG